MSVDIYKGDYVLIFVLIFVVLLICLIAVCFCYTASSIGSSESTTVAMNEPQTDIRSRPTYHLPGPLVPRDLPPSYLELLEKENKEKPPPPYEQLNQQDQHTRCVITQDFECRI